jgi:hypothetical protein
VQLRVGAVNLFARDYLSGRAVSANGLTQSAYNTARTYPQLNVRLEMKL